MLVKEVKSRNIFKQIEFKYHKLSCDKKYLRKNEKIESSVVCDW